MPRNSPKKRLPPPEGSETPPEQQAPLRASSDDITDEEAERALTAAKILTATKSPSATLNELVHLHGMTRADATNALSYVLQHLGIEARELNIQFELIMLITSTKKISELAGRAGKLDTALAANRELFKILKAWQALTPGRS